jgi:IS605 OrfB family transposase
MANQLSGQIVAFAAAHEAEVIVFEHLKQFRPKAGRKGSTLRQRFHGWLHRLLADKTVERAQEACIRTAFVNPHGTSKFAYDGSGEVKRDTNNRALATFSNGKRYNADLNASYNIAARWFARVLGLSGRKAKADATGKSSGASSRMPTTLSTLWLYAQSGRVAKLEAATTPCNG